MKTIKTITAILFILLVCNTASATIGNSNPPWGGPDVPPDGTCTNDTGYFTNETPDNGDDNIDITAKGVQTCIDVIVPSGCTVNITFQWLNWSQYYDFWLIWAYEQDWWWDEIDWATEPTWDNDSFWHNYSRLEISSSQQVCTWNDNVSCYTENDWLTEWSDWRVIGEYECQNNVSFNTTCYYYFVAEECSISYIWPPSPNGTACPCCDAMCVTIHNETGNPMNLTIYRNDSTNETFYIVNKYIDIINGTYCFCIDGHMADFYYPMRFNETYHWYVNITDTITGVKSNSSMFQFRTVENLSRCPCGFEIIEAIANDTDTIRDDAWLVGLIIVFSVIPIYAIKRKRRRR